MSTISYYGVAQEIRLLYQTIPPYYPRIEERNVNEPYMLGLLKKSDEMSAKQTETGSVRSDKEQLTENEVAARLDVRDYIRVIQRGVREAFPGGSPQWKEFHVGEVFESSTARLIAVAADAVNGFEKYKDVLVTKGAVIERDRNNLVNAVAVLSATDTKQEHAKKSGSPDTTKAFHDSLDELVALVDFVYAAISAEFKKEPAVLKKFAEIKKLRNLPEPKPPKQDPPPPAS